MVLDPSPPPLTRSCVAAVALTYVLRLCVCMYVYVHVCMHVYVFRYRYGVATISRLLKIIGLFCRISSLLQGSFAKETYNFKELTNRSHPILCVAPFAAPWPFLPHIYMSHVTRVNMSRHTHCFWVSLGAEPFVAPRPFLPHKYIQTCHTYRWVMSHV